MANNTDKTETVMSSDMSDINDRPIPMPENYTGPTGGFDVVAQPDGRKVNGDPCDNNPRHFS